MLTLGLYTGNRISRLCPESVEIRSRRCNSWPQLLITNDTRAFLMVWWIEKILLAPSKGWTKRSVCLFSEIHQVLHRLKNKEKPMQNNFEAPVWQLKMVFECSIVWCDLRMGRAIVYWQRITSGSQNFQETGQFCQPIFQVLQWLFLSAFFGSSLAFKCC